MIATMARPKASLGRAVLLITWLYGSSLAVPPLPKNWNTSASPLHDGQDADWLVGFSDSAARSIPHIGQNRFGIVTAAAIELPFAFSSLCKLFFGFAKHLGTVAQGRES